MNDSLPPNPPTNAKKATMFGKILYSTRVITYLFAMIPGVVWMAQIDTSVYYWVYLIAITLIMPHIEELIRSKTEFYKKIDEFLFISPAFWSAILTGLLEYSIFILIGSAFLSYIGPLVVSGKRYILQYIIATCLGLFVGGYINGFVFNQSVPIVTQVVSVSNLVVYCFIMALGMYFNSKYLRKTRDVLFETNNTNDIFYKIFKETSTTLSIGNIMRSLLKVFSQQYFESVAFFQYDEEQNILKVIFYEGLHTNPNIIRLIKSIEISVVDINKQSYILSAFKENKTLYVNEIPDPKKLPLVDYQFYSLIPFHGLLIIPISVEDKLIGVTVFFSVQKEQTLKPMQLELLNRYLLQLGVIMNNALTHQKLTDDIHNIKKEMIQYERLQNELSRYLSPKIYERVFQNYQHSGISSQYKFLTICFTDIVGFTALAEHLEPEEMTQMLNHYLNEMNDIAFKYDGTVDKYLGDSIQLFYGDPISYGKKEDALRCCKMAMEMQKKVKELQHIWIQHGISKQLMIRVGIHSDFCSVGNFGSSHHLQYSIVGEPVAIANDLQTKCIPGGVLISKSTHDLVRDHFKFSEYIDSGEHLYQIISEED